MIDVKIVYVAMQEDKDYYTDELCRITGFGFEDMCEALLRLQAGGLIVLTVGGVPRKRQYRTRQTTLNLGVFGPGKLQLKSIGSTAANQRCAL